MDYNTKIEYAKKIAEQLQGRKSTQEIKADLKSEGFYQPDIVEIMISARNILGQKYSSKIKEYLVENKEIKGSEDFSLLEDDLIDKLISMETQALTHAEKKRVTKLVKEEVEIEEILGQIDIRFLSLDKAVIQINELLKVKEQNSGSGRMLNIIGGIGLIILTGIILVVSGRLFYVLPIIGLYLIVKGFTTEDTQYD